MSVPRICPLICSAIGDEFILRDGDTSCACRELCRGSHFRVNRTACSIFRPESDRTFGDYLRRQGCAVSSTMTLCELEKDPMRYSMSGLHLLSLCKVMYRIQQNIRCIYSLLHIYIPNF
ncbi:hypothetical protein TNCV_2438671 [Trichonephila clavipes]|nr:hypothetical protein TNCV_2438671 [Trichonephila clavipes]